MFHAKDAATRSKNAITSQKLALSSSLLYKRYMRKFEGTVSTFGSHCKGRPECTDGPCDAVCERTPRIVKTMAPLIKGRTKYALACREREEIHR